VFAVVLAVQWIPAIYASLIHDLPIAIGSSCTAHSPSVRERCIRNHLEGRFDYLEGRGDE
jgi:hypothetical protein